MGQRVPLEDRAANYVINLIDTHIRETGVAPATRLENVFQIVTAFRIAGMKRGIVDRVGTIVQDGPFKGMQFLDEVTEGAYLPKLLGSYERELHDAIERIADAQYDAIINIGCAEGYYAVGLALRTEADIYAYDIEDAAQQACADLARRNRVEGRVTVGPGFRHGDFARFDGRRTLVLCDIEGDELDLLDPGKAPALRHMDMLVEIHRIDGIWTSDRLLPRFAETHSVTMIEPVSRDTARYPGLSELSETDRFLALLERMDPTRWAFLEAKSRR